MGEFTHMMKNPIKERDDRIVALEEYVVRLKEREADLVRQNVALMGQNGRLQQEVERLTVERDAAFSRGAAAMREAAVAVASKRANLQRFTDSDLAWGRSAECIRDELRHLPVPEDKS
jgi:predicted  nucleic acid-binding Zn-ribbon protein